HERVLLAHGLDEFHHRRGRARDGEREVRHAQLALVPEYDDALAAPQLRELIGGQLQTALIGRRSVEPRPADAHAFDAVGDRLLDEALRGALAIRAPRVLDRG